MLCKTSPLLRVTLEIWYAVNGVVKRHSHFWDAKSVNDVFDFKINDILNDIYAGSLKRAYHKSDRHMKDSEKTVQRRSCTHAACTHGLSKVGEDSCEDSCKD